MELILQLAEWIQRTLSHPENTITSVFKGPSSFSKGYMREMVGVALKGAKGNRYLKEISLSTLDKGTIEVITILFGLFVGNPYIHISNYVVSIL